jgi:hypothetical protein
LKNTRRRENLVVVCGPKTSPAVGKAYDADPRLSFETLADGRWALRERDSDRVHTSPTDNPDRPEPRDVAYLGRLPRPDGNGTFLLIGGVHAIGSLGVAQYVSDHLAEVYDEAGTRPFSMVVGCGYDRKIKKITDATPVTPVLLHEDR